MSAPDFKPSGIYKPGNYIVLTKAEREAYEAIRQAAIYWQRTPTAEARENMRESLAAFDALQSDE